MMIKTKLLSLSCACGIAAFMAPLASADTIFGIYAGVGSWNAEPDGDFGSGDQSATAEELGLEDNQNIYAYVAVEHPIPVVPNVRLQYQELLTSGESEIARDFTFGGRTITLTGDTQSEFDLSHFDATFYYEILDNWVNLDIGLTVRVFDATADVDGSSNDNSDVNADIDGSINKEFSGAIPLGYLRGRIDLPLTGWHVTAVANVLTLDDDSITDFSGSLGYQSNGLLLDFGFDLGYRVMTLDITDDDFDADVEVSGMFGSIMMHF